MHTPHPLVSMAAQTRVGARMPVVPEAATVVLTAAPTAASVAAQMLTAAVTGSQL